MEEQRQAIRTKLNRVFQEVFDDDSIQVFDDMTAKDIQEWDSLMHITLVVATEREFQLKLNASEIGKLENVGAMIDLIIKRTA